MWFCQLLYTHIDKTLIQEYQFTMNLDAQIVDHNWVSNILCIYIYLFFFFFRNFADFTGHLNINHNISVELRHKSFVIMAPPSTGHSGPG